MNIKQFKLTNNEEIVCEVVEWDTRDEIGDILVKKALRIIAVEDYQRGYRFFAFRPWMSFQDDPESLQTLNSSHVIVTTNPTKSILKHYKACLTAINHDLKLDKSGKKKKVYANLDEIQEAMRELTDDEIDDFLERKYGAMVEPEPFPDSDSGKIIQFKPKSNKTFH
tara:strand:- start:1486 stop:1986 length:501 start_codon:yes stop_codon:yes gene_type:complete